MTTTTATTAMTVKEIKATVHNALGTTTPNEVKEKLNITGNASTRLFWETALAAIPQTTTETTETTTEIPQTTTTLDAHGVYTVTVTENSPIVTLTAVDREIETPQPSDPVNVTEITTDTPCAETPVNEPVSPITPVTTTPVQRVPRKRTKRHTVAHTFTQMLRNERRPMTFTMPVGFSPRILVA